MLALSMWLPSGRPSGGVGAVERVALDRVAVDRLEVAGRPGEPDRVWRQVVVELVDEVEHLDGVLVRVGLPRERHRRGPTSTTKLGGTQFGPVERGERVGERLVAARGDLLAGVGDVVVVQVQVDVGDVAGQARRVVRQPVVLGQVDAAAAGRPRARSGSCPTRSRCPWPDDALPEQRAARLRVDDVEEALRAGHRLPAPGEAAHRLEQHQLGAVAAGEVGAPVAERARCARRSPWSGRTCRRRPCRGPRRASKPRASRRWPAGSATASRRPGSAGRPWPRGP